MIPDPSLKALSVGDNTRGTWIWDQSLLTVRINTRTRVKTIGLGPRWDWINSGLQAPRSIVTDHYLLDSEGVLIPDSLSPANDTKLGVQILPMSISLDLSSDLKG